MNFWVGLIIGLVIGWVLEWVIDWLFWRREDEAVAPSRTIDVNLQGKLSALEAEKAERKRGEEEKRKSEEGKNQNTPPNIKFKDYIRRQDKEVELLKTIPPKLKPFYKNRVNIYFEDIDTI